MLLDATPGLGGRSAVEVARMAGDLERAGYAGVWSGETAHDVFLPLTLAAAATSTVTIGCGIAVAFARNPMSIAVLGNDLQALSRGRFVLGLGTQVRAHIERRFGMAWSAPSARMREFVEAVRAIWRSWADATPLEFQGEHYRHDLMTSVFDPGPNPYGNPPIMIAAVGTRMTEVAGEVADGVLAHGFSTGRYLREVTLPALERGRGRAQSPAQRRTVCHSATVVTGRDERDVLAARGAARRSIAFYASTPAYRPVLDLHGWGALQPELARLARENRWSEMPDLIEDDVLDAFAVVCEPSSLTTALRDRYEGLVDRLSLNFAHPVPAELTADVAREFNGRAAAAMVARS
jgi:probable F420-dependent oxidoreductase